MKNLLRTMLIVIAAATNAVWAVGFESTPAANSRNTDFTDGKKAIDAKKWDAAVDAFSRAVTTDPRNPDIHNFLGYAYRHVNKLDLSFKHYDEALRLDPNHRGANEYIGWAYLMTGKLANAEEHLARLEKICGKSCEEYQDLEKGIANFKKVK